MKYMQIKPSEFHRRINSEEKARNLVWQTKFSGKPFICTKCKGEEYWAYHTEPEIRKCKACAKLVRLRKGTLFENSKTSMLTWLKALHFVMTSKRGVSALELQRHLGMSSYGTTWAILHKIRRALQSRDDQYKLKDVIELDGTGFGNASTGNQRRVLVAIETKEWTDALGKKKEKAGFAKVVVANETRENAEAFLEKNVDSKSTINTDGGAAFKHITKFDVDYRDTDSKQDKIDSWLPWVHRFISNAKTWVLGTHHGVEAKYLDLYLAEYTYRFNRRHDPNGLFHRALTACTVSKPYTYGSLFG